jgi:hypothetical protein
MDKLFNESEIVRSVQAFILNELISVFLWIAIRNIQITCKFNKPF